MVDFVGWGVYPVLSTWWLDLREFMGLSCITKPRTLDITGKTYLSYWQQKERIIPKNIQHFTADVRTKEQLYTLI